MIKIPGPRRSAAGPFLFPMNSPVLRCLAFTTALLGATFLRAETPVSVPTSAQAVSGRLAAGDVAPDFAVVGPKGETIHLADFKGRVVVVDVSATWCGPCQAAMPNNDRIFRKYADQRVVLLGVTTDDTREAYDGWVQRNSGKYAFTMSFDPAGREGWKESTFNTQYHVSGFPTMFVIGRDGKITETISGGGPGEDYRLEYALARAGAKVDLAAIPPEPKKDPNEPKSIPMMMKTPAMKVALPMIGMGGAAPAGGGFTPAKFGSLGRGAEVPDFSVTGADGQPVKLSSFRGRTLLVQFSTSNGPQPWFTKIAAAYKDQPLALLAVFSATERADFDKWVAAHPNPGFAVAWDPAGKAWAENVTNTIFGVGMYPATVVLNAEGQLWSGAIGMGAKVEAMAYSMLARNGVQLTTEHMDALVAAGGAMRAGGTINPAPGSDKPAPPQAALLAPGAIAPDFLMKDAAGHDVRLSDFKGKVVILDFWATWCGPCMASMPHTQGLAAKYRDQNVVVLGAGTSDKIASFQEWIPKNQPKYPDIRFAYDLNERESPTFEDRASAKLYHVAGIPTQFVIGRDGRIAGVVVGYDGEGDARMEAALATAGVKVDAVVVAKGREQVAKEEKASNKAAAEAVKKPRAPFRESYGKLRAGEVVPDFTVLTPEGKVAKFSDYAKGKTVILDFWATWCGPCQKAMPHYQEIYDRYRDKNVVILGVCCFDTRENYDKWVAEHKGKLTFPTVFDPVGKPESKDKEAYAKTVMMQLSHGSLTPLPTTLVVNAAGQLVGSYAGYGEVARDALANLLMIAGVELAVADKPKVFFPAGSTAKPVVNLPAKTNPKAGTLQAGTVAPDFTMQTAAGKEVKLSDFKGKVVILDFWATWCVPCIASMPHTQEIAAKYKDQGVVVLASGTSDYIAKFKEWIPKNQPKYPDLLFAFDPNERDSATFDQRASSKHYHVMGIPTQFVIDREGKITATIVGNGGKEDARTEAALARAGVKVDAARNAAGEKQLTAAAEEEAERAAAMADEEKNPKPHFYESYGQVKAGQPAPDFTAQDAAGAAVKFSDLAKGKTVVLSFWAAGHGIPADLLAFQDAWAKKYAAQSVLFLGVGAYGSREDFDKWHAANAPKISFPVVFDPAGAPPRPAKSPDEMNAEEKTAFRAATHAHFGKVIPMAISGGMMAPIPNNLVIDAKGKFIGFYVGAGPQSADSLGNLLLRAGVKLAPEDMPKKVFTAEETKEKPQEAKVALLKVGAAAPDFPATDAAGKPVKVSDYRGKVIILDFWATWCGPCLNSMPHTQEVAARYKDQGVVVLANCTSDDRKKFETWVKRNQEQYPDINFSHDPQERGPDRASRKLYGVGGIPQQFIIDREGKVVALVTGYLKGEALLDAALAKAGVKVDPALVAKAVEDLKKRE